jgi:hypothetical protein
VLSEFGGVLEGALDIIEKAGVWHSNLASYVHLHWFTFALEPNQRNCSHRRALLSVAGQRSAWSECPCQTRAPEGLSRVH